MKPLKLSGKWPQGLLLILPIILSLFAAPVARSEGSRELVSQGGDRPWLEVRDNVYIEQFLRYTTIQVSVNQGEWLNLGSSAMGIGDGNIIATAPNGATINCQDPPFLGTGLIENRNQENNGPGTGTDGSIGVGLGPTGRYEPCGRQVQAGEQGIWEIEFVPPNRPGGLPSAIDNPAGSLNWVQAANDFATAAWDVTVRTDANNTDTQNGRVFTDLLALNMLAQGRELNSEVFVLTTDGFIYSTDMNRLDPFGFVFLANNKGLLDTDLSPLYRSSPGLINDGPGGPPATNQNNSVPLQAAGVTIQPPVHRIFFNEPATDLETLPSPILRTPTRPVVSELAFIGDIENTTLEGVGGTFQFDSSIEGSYQIVIRDDANNIVRILQNTVASGTNNITWDGTNEIGADLPPGEYEFEITVRAGEYHFPLLDVENSGGLTFTLRNPPLPLPSEGPGTPIFRAGTNATTAFYDNTSFTTADGIFVAMPSLADGNPGATDPVFGTGPGSSNPQPTNYHQFGDGFGDKKAIDTWIYFSSQPKFNTLVIIDPNVTLTSTKSVQLLTDVNDNGQVDPGDTLRYTISLTNTGNSAATGVQLTDTPDVNTTLVVGSVNPNQGTVTLGNTPGNTTVDVALGMIAGNGGTATVTFDVTVNSPIPNTVTEIANQGRVRGSNFPPILTDDPTTQNIPNDRTTISLNNPILGVTKQLTNVVNNGDGTHDVSYTIRVHNLGNVPLNNVQITEDLFGTENSTFAGSAAPPEIISTQLVPGPNNEPNPLNTTNPNFNGNADKDLLAGTEVLPVGATAAIAFTVRVTPGRNLGAYENNATALASGPGGTDVTDTSTDGTNPDPDGDGDPTNDDNPTEVTFVGTPQLELQKRITRINGTEVGQFDTLPNWPTNLVRGITNSAEIQPGDEVEYTIYFFSAGSAPLEKAMVCDPLQDFQTFRTDTFNGQNPIEGTFGAEVGIAFALNPTTNLDLPTAYLRSANSASNRGRFYPSGTTAPPVCRLPNVRGAVVVEIGNLGVGDYGFIRFRVRID
ncbi:FlgD immunoglobulin-like domain containing protein [Oscillatoria acuminata]|uniref:Conserved repeat protein n=1 Tax=Oscillatoria acuminata PCC 6304 TaxID=56110 RepID=K9TL44_9CYAN|nr:FlgD immunoglobulin-like domain containing protein [Oscillatoria acuminata]AFY82744.1 conserved repeat protein [Oscillatoria acuminata PCC 6304]